MSARDKMFGGRELGPVGPTCRVDVYAYVVERRVNVTRPITSVDRDDRSFTVNKDHQLLVIYALTDSDKVGLSSVVNVQRPLLSHTYTFTLHTL